MNLLHLSWEVYSDRYYSWIDCPNLYSLELGNYTFYESSYELKGIIVMVLIKIDLPNLYSIALGDTSFYESSLEIKGILISLLIIDLPNLYSFELGKYTFTLSPSVVISSIWLKWVNS